MCECDPVTTKLVHLMNRPDSRLNPDPVPAPAEKNLPDFVFLIEKKILEPKKYFWLIVIRVAWNVEKSCF